MIGHWSPFVITLHEYLWYLAFIVWSLLSSVSTWRAVNEYAKKRTNDRISNHINMLSLCMRADGVGSLWALWSMCCNRDDVQTSNPFYMALMAHCFYGSHIPVLSFPHILLFFFFLHFPFHVLSHPFASLCSDFWINYYYSLEAFIELHDLPIFYSGRFVHLNSIQFNNRMVPILWIHLRIYVGHFGSFWNTLYTDYYTYLIV